MVSTSLSTSLVSTQMGEGVHPPNSLKRAHLPSITGIPAAGPMSPRPSTAEPSVITATRLLRRVRVKDFHSPLDFPAGLGHAGGIQKGQVVPGLDMPAGPPRSSPQFMRSRDS